jgi:hypothetical protein
VARKREVIEPPPGDKRYARRDERGRFTRDQVDVDRSLGQDARHSATTRVSNGQDDQGDRGM